MAPAALPGADVPIVPWGDSAAGQASVDKIPASAADAIAIAAGRAHNIALKANGTVVGWFTNDFGQSEVPAELSGVVAIAAGYDHNLALKSDGTVVAWGKNDSGQATVPGGLTGVVAVSANADRSLALKNDGSVVAWGVTAGVVPTGLQAIAIAAGVSHNLALRGDGTVVGWGVNSFGETIPPVGLSNVIAVAAGNQFSLALREDGTIVAWGNNTFGATNVPAAATSVIAITAGFGQALALKADGTVLAWGYNGMGEATVPPGLPSARGIAGGFDHSMALVGDQPLAPLISGQPVSQIARMGATVRFRVGVLGSPTVSYLWKKNGVDLPGETGPGLQLLDVHSSAQGTYTVTVNNTLGGTTSAGAALIVGPAVLWGGNSFNQTAFTNMPLSLSNIVAISAGGGHNAAVKADGTLVGWGLETYGPNVPPAIANGVAVATGYDHSLALRSDGTVVAWGRNDFGESTVPVGLSGVVAISANERHSLALKNDGTLVAWGHGNLGQTNVPAGLVGVLAIASGVNHNLAVKSDGTVISWGSAGAAVPAGLNNVRAVAAGNDFSLALKQDGTVVAWGGALPDEGQTNVPPGLADVVAIAAGFAHAAALRADGTVVAWGRNAAGQSTVPTFLSGAWAVSAGFEHSAALGGALTIPPIIGGGPVSQSIDIGGSVRFQVQAITFAPVTYQWQRNGVDLDGQTGSSLLLTGVAADEAGDYTVIVTSAFGTVTSSGATLTVSANPPVITQQPVSTRVRPGVSVTLSVTATGSGLNYQWRKNGVPISGETASSLVFTKVRVLDMGTYSVEVSNASGPTLSDNADLTVLPVVPWGGNTFGLNQSTLNDVPLSVFNATGIAAGGGHNAAVQADGTVVAWIYNQYGQSTVPPSLNGVVAVAAGYDHNLALKDDGSVVAWGRNDFGVGQSIVPSGLTGVVAISANEYYSLALKSDGTAVAWGNSSPPPSFPAPAIGISAGVHHSLAVLNDGSVVTWGASLPPSLDVPPAALSGVIAVAAGNGFSLALKNDGTVVAWGDNTFGQTTVPGTATGVIAIAAGDSHALALRSDSTIVGWGNNAGGRATVPSGLTNVVAISAGYEHSLALVKEATVLTVEDITAVDRVYDGTTDAALDTSGAVLVGVAPGDEVTLETAGAVATFANKTVGTAKTVTITGLTLSGAHAGNYILTQPTATASITAAPLTVTGITANNKVYDGNTAATLNTGAAALQGVVPGDTVTFDVSGATGAFANKHVGTAKTVTMSGATVAGADSANYLLTQPTTTANITAAGLTVTGITANNKVYNGNTVATLNTAGGTLQGLVSGDLVTLETASATGTFADKHVGTAKTVTVSGLALSGDDSGNYLLTQPTTTANITGAGLTVTGVTANSKVYKGNTAATLNTIGGTLQGLVFGDLVTLETGSAAGAFANKHVGTAKTVTITGLTISGDDSGNYLLTQPTATADITTAGLTVTGITANNRVYDGNTAVTLNTGAAVLQGLVAGDLVSLDVGGATGVFANKHVGTAKTVTITVLAISGDDSGNYLLIQPTATANITAASLPVTGITANNKVYDGTTAATLVTAAATLVGFVPGDSVSLVTAGAVGTFADAEVGVDKTVQISGLTLAASDAGNYLLTQPTTTATIAASALTVVGITAANKVYDATTTATLNTGGAVLVGVVSPDELTLSVALAVGTFATKDVGVSKTVQVSGLVLGGADAANYTLAQPTTTADITSAGLTVAGITVVPKVYDGTTLATLGAAGASLVGVAAGDDVIVDASGATGTFATETVGTGKTVAISGVTINGEDAENYTVTQPTATGTIALRDLTVNGITANNKVYDGHTTATLNTGGAALQGLVAGDAVTLNTSGATGAFADNTVGTAKPVTIAGITIGGTDSGNYTLTQPGTTADITAHGLTVTGITANNKGYDGHTTATLNTGGAALQGLVAGDVVTLNTSGATGTFGDENVGTAKPVAIAGVTIGGTDSGNYTLTQPSATANITAQGLTVTGVTANNKVYDGNTTATLNAGAAALQGLVAADAVTLNTSGATGTFANENVGTAKVVTIAGLSISGTDSGNYTLTQPSAAANITRGALTVHGITANNKAYNGNTAATLNTSGAVPQGLVAGDAVTLNTSGAIGTFADKNVGTAKTVTIVGVTFGGADSGNYELTQPSATANITKATLIAKADDKGRLVGQPNPVFTITYTGFVAGEGVSELDSQPTANTPAPVSSGVGQYPISLSGGSDNNYGFTLLGGTLFVEEALLDLSMRFLQGTPGHFQISTVGEPNRQYRVQASADLIEWVDIGTVDAASDGLIVFTDTNAGAQLYRFYRLQAD